MVGPWATGALAHQLPKQFEVAESRSPPVLKRTRPLTPPVSNCGRLDPDQAREKGLLWRPAWLSSLTRQFDSTPRPSPSSSLPSPLPSPLPPVSRPTLRASGAERNLTAPVTNHKRGRGSEPIGASGGGRPSASSRLREGARGMSWARPCASASVRSPTRCEEKRLRAV